MATHSHELGPRAYQVVTLLHLDRVGFRLHSSMITQPHHRRSIRLPGYDYTAAGAYFITICTQGRECLFGQVVDGEMRLNAPGEIVRAEWEKSAALRAEIELGPYAVMPNHFHAIVVIADDGRGTARRVPTVEQFGKPVAGSVPTIVRAFKSAVTRQINLVRQTPGAAVWQRNYYEHIIRNESSYENIAAYILNNPRQWEVDRLFKAG